MSPSRLSCRSSILVELEFEGAGFCGGRKTGEPKTTKRTNEKLNPHIAPFRHRTRATLVGGERSHNCVIPAPCLPDILYSSFEDFKQDVLADVSQDLFS